MKHGFISMALAAALALGVANIAQAQIGGSSGDKAGSDPASSNPNRAGDKDKAKSGTTGQGQQGSGMSQGTPKSGNAPEHEDANTGTRNNENKDPPQGAR